MNKELCIKVGKTFLDKDCAVYQIHRVEKTAVVSPIRCRWQHRAKEG